MDKAGIAARFINSTNSHIFLTGKAGTGKTTFLHDLSASTHKRHLIVAPTGIAALNANGVTIHSQFLLPFGTFLPGRNLPPDIPEGFNYYTENILARKHPLNAKRREVLRDIDLLIIDEVSMLRADLMDALDYRMRSVKRNYKQAFGGIQLLLIGDLFQLAPVVKSIDWKLMKHFYRNPYFFEALSLQEDGFVYIELDKIYRQQDTAFIGILNHLRNNTLSNQDLMDLNRHYHPNAIAEEGVITITTHNDQAEAMNRKALQRLNTNSYFFQAFLQGEFPERIFPVSERLELKVGAQIMFVKNDTKEAMYFNGKLATVTAIETDNIEVLFADGSTKYNLRLETWENKKYSIKQSTKEMEEEVIGTFTQYPVKLAWAITVHKSQGLTFEKAIIDVGRAFAPGQVYVALSRLRSLDGLVLKTPINPNVVSCDRQVVEFSKKYDLQNKLTQILQNQQALFLKNLLQETFSFQDILKQLDFTRKKHDTSTFADEDMRNAAEKLSTMLEAERLNTKTFCLQLHQLLAENNYEALLDRIEKGSAYYQNFLFSCIEFLLIHKSETDQFTRTKAYSNALSELDLLFMKKLEEISHAAYIVSGILNNKEIIRQKALDKQLQNKRNELLKKVEQYIKDHPKSSALKSGRKRKKGSTKRIAGSTYLETYKLLKEGLNIEQISEKRNLKKSTIETHLTRGIGEGRINIEQVIDRQAIHQIQIAYEQHKEESISGLYQILRGVYSYGQIRMLISHVNFKRKVES